MTPETSRRRILITGSTAGIGKATAAALLDQGHGVILHARVPERLATVHDLLGRGAASVVGDLADPDQVRGLAEQVTGLGPIDAVIHNAGILEGPDLVQVNVVAPYVLTALVPVSRLVYLSSSMHLSGRPRVPLADGPNGEKTLSYSDSKLLVTVLMAAVARRRPDVLAHAVDPGWVPTRMGGPSATDDLDEAHRTQAWLVTANPARIEPRSGGYWFHHQARRPHPAAADAAFQDDLLAHLEARTGITLPTTR
jgi:NAD(P)-dependent dehydrogenase (short-subunit alcohol dehydrogenase family)